MTTERWYGKANALAQAWASNFGKPPTHACVCLALAVAEHETQCGDAWPGDHNWGACTKGGLSTAQRGALAAAGVHAVLSPSAARRAAEDAARVALVAAGCGPMADQAIHVDSAPRAGPYFTFFGKFPTDVEGAAYFVHVLAEQRASCRAVLERGGSAYELASAMYRSRYYTGFHDPHVAGGDEQNISDYTSGVSRVLAGIAHALDGWTVGAEPPPAYTEPAAPFDLYSAEGVQKALNALENAGLKEDGIAGPKTAAAVIMFQRAHGLTPDGVVGKATRGALASALAKLTSP